LGMGLSFRQMEETESIQLYRIIQCQAGREPDLFLSDG